MKPYFETPVFNWHEGRLATIYHRQYIDSARRFADAPRLTAAHVEALDLFDALANDPALHMKRRIEPGDRGGIVLRDTVPFIVLMMLCLALVVWQPWIVTMFLR